MRALLLASIFAIVSVMPASATVYRWTALLDGSQEVPPVVTLGSGSAFGTLDDVANELTWNISYMNLGVVTGMHFHNAARGKNGSVVVNIGAISGLGSPNIGGAPISADQVAQILAAKWYINVHTEEVPPGEIRGQVLVPLPAGAGLLASALAAFAVVRRRQQRT